jgi:hypothetical protein
MLNESVVESCDLQSLKDGLLEICLVCIQF